MFLTKLVRGSCWLPFSPVLGLMFSSLLSLCWFSVLRTTRGHSKGVWDEASISGAVLTQVLLVLFAGQGRDRATRLMEWGSG